MVARTYSVSLNGVEANLVEVQCSVTSGLPHFAIVGLPDKAVSEARERIRAAFSSMAISLPSKRITVNLSPANMLKEGSHFDLPIALAVLGAIEALPEDEVNQFVSIGELGLDGGLIAVPGGLPAALCAAEANYCFFCPKASAGEAAWIDTLSVYGGKHLRDILYHILGQRPLCPASPSPIGSEAKMLTDLADVKGQERAKRAMEISAAGRHHMFMVGPPGAGKSMLAGRMASIMPPLTPLEALDTAMIQSVAGVLNDGTISSQRPFRDPHHTASVIALVGGGRRAMPGEISLAHHGILFMDEFPEFPRTVLETLRQPIETGQVVIARANAHIRYPCRFLLIAAANPCRCGYMYEPAHACARAPICGEDYLGRISGPLLDRFDLRLEIPPVSFSDLDQGPSGETSACIRARVESAHDIQKARYAAYPGIEKNADAEGELLKKIATPTRDGRHLLLRVAEKMSLTARGYHRILRLARTIADLEGVDQVKRSHIAEAAGLRLTKTGQKKQTLPPRFIATGEAGGGGLKKVRNIADF